MKQLQQEAKKIMEGRRQADVDERLNDVRMTREYGKLLEAQEMKREQFRAEQARRGDRNSGAFLDTVISAQVAKTEKFES